VGAGRGDFGGPERRAVDVVRPGLVRRALADRVLQQISVGLSVVSLGGERMAASIASLSWPSTSG
jgi:hypothetical protein